jgi:hypothetical protein
MGITHVVTDRSWPGGEPATSSAPATFYRLPNPLGRVWIVFQDRVVAPEDTLEILTNPTFEPSTAVLLETEYPMRAHSHLTAGRAQILSLRDAPNRVTIRASLEAPGYLVLADTWYPGWNVTVDGEQAELLRANHAFRAVKLDGGTHVVEMSYRPLATILGCWISLGTLAALISGYLATARLGRG